MEPRLARSDREISEPGRRALLRLRPWVPEIVFVVVTTAAGLWAGGRWLDPSGDVGIWWSLGERLAQGERYYRDIYLQYGPLSPYLVSVLARVFGSSATYFLLTNLLLPVLKNTLNSRVVSVSSLAHTSGKLDFANLQGEQKFNGWKAYSDSKLENVLFTFALTRRLAGSGVTANCLHPGFVKTSFGHGNSGLVSSLLRLGQNLFAISPEAGAKTMIHLASSPDVAGVTGKYFDKSKAVNSSAASLDQALQEKLWAHSEKLAGLG